MAFSTFRAAATQPFEITGWGRKATAYLGSGADSFSNPANTHASPGFTVPSVSILKPANASLVPSPFVHDIAYCGEVNAKTHNTLWLLLATYPQGLPRESNKIVFINMSF